MDLDESEYRAMLSGYTDNEGMPVWSSKDLSINDASSLIDLLERRIEKTPNLKERVYASTRQLGFIRLLWSRVSRAANEDRQRVSLNSFLRRRFHAYRFDHIPRSSVPKIIKSLRSMKERRAHEYAQ
jgi:hypothetical protein